MLVGTAFPLVGRAVERPHVEENVHTAFALIFQGHAKRGTRLTNEPLLHALFRSVINQYTDSLPSKKVNIGKLQREFLKIKCIYLK